MYIYIYIDIASNNAAVITGVMKYAGLEKRTEPSQRYRRKPRNTQG